MPKSLTEILKTRRVQSKANWMYIDPETRTLQTENGAELSYGELAALAKYLTNFIRESHEEPGMLPAVVPLNYVKFTRAIQKSLERADSLMASLQKARP